MPDLRRPRRGPAAVERRLLLRDDSGVIAVVTAIVVAAVLVPVAALGMTSYVRAGVRQEMQRSAESGALAGASSLALLNLGTVPVGDLLDPTVDLSYVWPAAIASPLGPTGRACRAAHSAYGRPLNEPARDPADRSPASAAFAADPTCDAYYTPDPLFAGCVGSVYTAVQTLTGTLTTRLDALLGALTAPVLGFPNPLAVLAPQLGSTQRVINTTLALVPAVTHNGVQVELDTAVAAPLDAVLLSTAPTPTTNTAAARRMFKPILPDLESLLGLTGEQVETLLGAPGLGETLDTLLPASVLTPVQRLVVSTLQTAIMALKALVGAVQASDLVPFLDATLESAANLLRSVAGPLLSLLEPLLAPLLGPVSAPPLTSVTGPCLQAVQEILDDLSFALTINKDPQDQDLLHCVVQRVLGQLDVLSSVTPTVSCVNRVFRAQLAPTT